MHFIDFLLHLMCFICWILKSVYIFSFDYLIPVIGYILPVLTKYTSQLFSLILRIFFTYISPCIIQVINGTTYVFTKVLNGISVASMKIIDSDTNLEYAHAIIMVSILAVLVYFHVTQKIFRLFYQSYQFGSLYFRFLGNILKMLLVCVRFIYRKVAVVLLCKPELIDDERPKSKKRGLSKDDSTMEHSRKNDSKNEKRHHISTTNGISGTIDGPTHRLKEE